MIRVLLRGGRHDMTVAEIAFGGRWLIAPILTKCGLFYERYEWHGNDTADYIGLRRAQRLQWPLKKIQIPQ